MSMNKENRMKEFEKWYKENLYDRTETEKAWKAALEWALDCSGDVDIISKIYSELLGK